MAKATIDKLKSKMQSKSKSLVGKQKNLDVNKNGKLDAEDFKMLRGKKIKEGFKNTKDFEKFLEEIDGMGEFQIKKIMGKDYIDTPGFYSDEKDDYDDVIDLMKSNMGKSDFEKLKKYWETKVSDEQNYAEGGEIKFIKTKFNSHKNHNPSADILEGHLDKDSYITYVVYIKDAGRAKAGEEFMEYYIGENYKLGSNKKSHSRVYSVDKIPSKYKKAWDKLKSEYNEKHKDSMAMGGEVKSKFKIDDMVYSYQNKDYAAPINYVKFSPWNSNSDSHHNDTYKYRLSLKDGHSNWIDEKSLYKTKQNEYADGGMMADGGESFDADYWEGYYDGDRKINFMHPNVQIAEFVGSVVDDSENENDFKLSKKDYESVLDLSYKFHQKKGWISQSIVETMIMQESKGEYKKGGMMANGGFTQYGKPMGFEEESDSVYEIHHKPEMNAKNPYLIWDKIDGVYVAEFPNNQRALHYIDSKKSGYYAKGGEVDEEKMIEKLEEQFKGKDLWEDEILDEYEVKMFDWEEFNDEETFNKWKRSKEKKNYIVPFESDDDSYVFILVPKNKMEDGGSIPDNYKGKTANEVWNEWTFQQKWHFLEDHADDIKKNGFVPRGSWMMIAKTKSWENLDKSIQHILTWHTIQGQYAKGGMMAKGGTIAQENNEMLQSNMKEIKHHVDELKNIVSNNTEVEPWVIAKTERASTDLSDVTHYLDGRKDKSLEMPFEQGGYMAEGGETMTKEVLIFDILGKDLIAVGDKINELLKITNDEKWIIALKRIQSSYERLEDRISIEDKKLGVIQIDSSMMAEGGEVKKVTDGNDTYYLTYIDSTHFYLSNSKDYKGNAFHIAEFRSRPFYDEVKSWLKSYNDEYMSYGGMTTKEDLQEIDYIVSVARDNDISSNNISLNEFEKQLFEKQNMVFTPEYIKAAYKKMKYKGYANGGMTTKDKKIADHIIKTYNMDEPGMAPVYANQLKREEARLNKTYGRDWQKTMTPAYKVNKFLNAVRLADNSIQLKDIKVEASPRGNWIVYEHGKVIMTVNNDMLDEQTIRTYNLEHHN